MRRLNVIWVLTGLMFIVCLLAPSSVHYVYAGTNPNCTAWLSWSDDYANPLGDYVTMPTGAEYLYIQLGGINQLAGCEFKLRWVPQEPPYSGCYEFSTGEHPSGSGTDCSWLMRGGQVEGINTSGNDYWLVAFTGDQCSVQCDSGNVSRALFDFTFCLEDIPGTFWLDYVKITDCNAVLDSCQIVADATILGGTPTALMESTWGRIKVLFR